MKVISSQKYTNEETVAAKMEEMANETYVELPVVDIEMKDNDGNDLYSLIDGHHRLAAAKELGLEIRFVEEKESEGLTGEAYLDARWMDSDWYDVITDVNVW